MWMILQQKHGLQVKRYVCLSCDINMLIGICFKFDRSTVQMLMSVLDNDGAKRRRCHRLKRRIYQNKVHNLLRPNLYKYLFAVNVW